MLPVPVSLAYQLRFERAVGARQQLALWGLPAAAHWAASLSSDLLMMFLVNAVLLIIGRAADELLLDGTAVQVGHG